MPRKAVIAVVGSGKDTGPDLSTAREMGRLIAANGWVLITGGRNAGVMKAANMGAKQADGLTIGILPNRDAEVSPDVDVAVVTDTGQARNNIIVLSADAVVACGVEGPGTASEIALAIKNGKPVIILGGSDAAHSFFGEIGGDRVENAETPAAAMKLIKERLG
jgi:uncharacterized protein (TIGR00725 family)